MRNVSEEDVFCFFEHQREPAANYMMALSTKKPHDEESYVAQWRGIFAANNIVAKTILVGDRVAGYVSSFFRGDTPEVSYWLGSEFWGQGIATLALEQFLEIQKSRPMYARVARDNPASVRVLEKCGFTMFEASTSYSNAEGIDVEEQVLILRA